MEIKKKYIEATLHNIKTPLTTVLGYLQLLSKKLGNTPEGSWAKEAYKQSLRIEDMLNDFRLIGDLDNILSKDLEDVKVSELINLAILEANKKEKYEYEVDLSNLSWTILDKKLLWAFICIFQKIQDESLSSIEISAQNNEVLVSWQCEAESKFTQYNQYTEKYIQFFIINKIFNNLNIRMSADQKESRPSLRIIYS